MPKEELIMSIILLILVAGCAQSAPELKEERTLSLQEIRTIIKQAEEQDNTALCNQISSLSAAVCDSIYERPLTNQFSYANCNMRNYCIGDIVTNRAIRAKNVALCGTIVAPDRKSNCYHQLAVELEDVSLCNEAKVSIDYDECIRDVAIVVDNQNLCEKASTPGWCYDHFAVKLNRPEVCENILLSEGNARYHCIVSAAKDAKWCAMLPADWQDACLKKVQA
jgi:hypothetical protein